MVWLLFAATVDRQSRHQSQPKSTRRCTHKWKPRGQRLMQPGGFGAPPMQPFPHQYPAGGVNPTPPFMASLPQEPPMPSWKVWKLSPVLRSGVGGLTSLHSFWCMVGGVGLIQPWLSVESSDSTRFEPTVQPLFF